MLAGSIEIENIVFPASTFAMQFTSAEQKVIRRVAETIRITVHKERKVVITIESSKFGMPHRLKLDGREQGGFPTLEQAKQVLHRMLANTPPSCIVWD